MLEESSTSCTLPFLQLVLLDWFLTLGEQFLGVYIVIYRCPPTGDSDHPLASFHEFARNWLTSLWPSLSPGFSVSVFPSNWFFPHCVAFEMFGLLGKKHKEEEVQITGEFQLSISSSLSFLVPARYPFLIFSEMLKAIHIWVVHFFRTFSFLFFFEILVSVALVSPILLVS